MKRVIAYIDGFNLFYSSLKGTKNKWLDLWSLCSSFLKDDQELVEVKYFSARVIAFNNDNSRVDNQTVYLSALRTNPKIKIELGFFSVKPVNMPQAKPFLENNKIEMVEVIKTEEKGSDVNLAVSLAVDALQDKFDYAMLFSNDSDMAKSVKIVTKVCNKRVGLYIDSKAKSFKTLKENTTHTHKINKTYFSRHQFPDSIELSTGKIITKPKSW
nr:MAG TPA: hypothetical protein [Caudoviricetes sp.]